MNLPQIPPDKANHLLFGGAIALLAALLATAAGLAPKAGAMALAAAAAAGVAKEGVDWWANRQAARAGLPLPHQVELWDALATAGGGLAVYVAWATGAAV